MFKRVFLGLSLASAAASGFAAGNLVSNGSFEADLPLTGAYVPNGFMYRPTLTDWAVVGNPTVLFDSNYRPVSDGLLAVQLERNSDKLSQTFATVSGEQYLLSFDLSSWWVGAPTNLANLLVNVGPSSQSFTASNPSYTSYTLAFTANSGSTTLTFENTGSTGISYPQIDKVSVVAVPEGGTYALMLAGLVFMGFVARRQNA